MGRLIAVFKYPVFEQTIRITIMNTTLCFQNTNFDVIDRNGQPWIQSRQLAAALGYKDEMSVTKIYERNSDEFTDAMTAKVKMTLGITPVDVRIFSLRGCHLIAMFARTKLAKAFRVWVLDVLDRLATPASPSATLTFQQKGKLKNLVNERVRTLPDEQRKGAYPRIWGALNHHFGTSEYANLPTAAFDAALAFVRTYTFPAVIEPPKEEETVLRFPALEPGMHLVRINASHEVVGARALPEGTAFVSCAAWDAFWQAMMNLRPTQMYT